MRIFLAAIALLAATLASTPPPSQAPPADPAKLGPQVGDRVPDFSLPDQHGAQRTLKSVLGPKGAMIVFFRSADW